VSKRLVVSDGTRERELQLVGRVVVGRDPTCDITYDHSLLSRRHAEFVSAGDLVVVRDLGSRNGVFVNGTKTAEHSLQAGDILQIGPLRVQYVVDRVPLSIAPEDHDAERTVFRPASSAVAAAIQEPTPTDDVDDDDDVTRLISAKPPAAGARLDGDVSAVREAALSGPLETPGTSVDILGPPPSDEAPYTPRVAPAPHPSRPLSEPLQSLRTFVFLRLLVLGALVLVAAAISFRVDGVMPPLTAFVVPVVVVAVAGYLVSGIIDRRFTHAIGDPRNRN
jgi:predicted component of type VI protein secretion system